MGNNKFSKMPDTPWHMGYPKKQEEDPRRHKSRCVFYKKGTCSCVKSDCFAIKCFGSSHCIYYAETEYQADRMLEALTPSLDKVIDSGRKLSKSIDVKAELKAKEQKRRAYFQKISKTVFNKQLKEHKYIYKNINIAELKHCKLCGFLLDKGTVTKICGYCGAVYSICDSENAFLVAGKQPVNEMKAKKKKCTSDQIVPTEKMPSKITSDVQTIVEEVKIYSLVCKWLSDSNRCSNETSRNYNRPCKMCELYSREKDVIKPKKK